MAGRGLGSGQSVPARSPLSVLVLPFLPSQNCPTPPVDGSSCSSALESCLLVRLDEFCAGNFEGKNWAIF